MAIRDTSVKFFSSTDAGAPTFDLNSGSGISVLDACLVNGYGSVAADSLVVADGIATLTVGGGHGFVNPGAADGLDVGVVVAVSGVTGALAALNAEWRATVVSATVLTWECGLASGTATGTISVKRAPAGWVKTYGNATDGAYRRPSVKASTMWLRVSDSAGTYATLTGYENMTGLDAGTGSFGGFYWYKSSTLPITSRKWFVVATDADVFVICDATNGGTYTGGFAFFDVISYAPIDTYRACLIGTGTTTGISQLYMLSSNAGHAMCRSYTGDPGAIAATKESHKISAIIGGSGNPWPAAVNSGAVFWPVEVWQSTTVVRGLVPGLLNPLHSAGPAAPVAAVGPIAGLGGGLVLMLRLTTTTRSVGFLIDKPWR